MIDTLLRSFAPHPCCGCGNVGSLLCTQCKYDIVSEPYAQCVSCESPTSGGGPCARCRPSSEFTYLWCVGKRNGALRALLDRYKFDSATEAAGHSAQLLDDALPVLPPDTTVVSVPTSPAHRRRRGFDHAALIARGFASRRQLAYAAPLRRHGDETQHFLGRQARAAIAKQLSVHTPVPSTVLLIDDIYTTGSTMTACARLLRANGCERLFGAVVARQTLDDNADLW